MARNSQLTDFEYKVVDGAVTDCLSSKRFQDAIASAITASISGATQKVQGDIQQIAEETAKQFKDDLKSNLAAFCEDWISSTGTLEVVPPNTRLLKSVGNYRVVVVEQPPTMRTLRFENAGRLNDGEHTVALPYVIFVVYVDSRGKVGGFYVGYATEPLRSLKSNVYSPNLPNMQDDLSVCQGDMVKRRHSSKDDFDLCSVTEEVIAGFWGSVFNSDLSSHFQAMCETDERLSSVSRWSQESKKDPLFVLGVQWRGRRRLEQLLNNITGGELRMQFAPIIDRAVQNASTKLNQYIVQFATDGLGGATANRRAVGQFRSKLYDFMYQACQSAIEKVKGQCEIDFSRKLARELEAKRSRTPQKRTYADGDYVYRPPTEATW